MRIQNIIEKLETDLFKFVIVMKSSTSNMRYWTQWNPLNNAIQDPHYAHIGCKATKLVAYGCHPTQKTYGLIETWDPDLQEESAQISQFQNTIGHLTKNQCRNQQIAPFPSNSREIHRIPYLPHSIYSKMPTPSSRHQSWRQDTWEAWKSFSKGGYSSLFSSSATSYAYPRSQ
jgi:hypothetical protein